MVRKLNLFYFSVYMNCHFFHCMIECLLIKESSFLLFLFLCEVVKDISFPTCQLLSPDSVRKSYPRGGKLTFSRCLGVGNLTLAATKMSNSPGSAPPPPPPWGLTLIGALSATLIVDSVSVRSGNELLPSAFSIRVFHAMCDG